MVKGGGDLDRRYRWLWIATIATSVATFVLVGLLAARDTGPPLPVLAYLPAFSLTDQRSAVVTRESLRGRPFVANFFFTSCPTSCPKLTARVAALQGEIRTRHLPVRLVSISVDPENDTPARLAAYAARYSADETMWSFLAGGDAELERAFVRGYELSCRKPEERGDADVSQIMHGDWLVLVDGEGRVRGYYDSRERSGRDALLADAARVANDPSVD